MSPGQGLREPQGLEAMVPVHYAACLAVSAACAARAARARPELAAGIAREGLPNLLRLLRKPYRSPPPLPAPELEEAEEMALLAKRAPAAALAMLAKTALAPFPGIPDPGGRAAPKVLALMRSIRRWGVSAPETRLAAIKAETATAVAVASEPSPQRAHRVHRHAWRSGRPSAFLPPGSVRRMSEDQLLSMLAAQRDFFLGPSMRWDELAAALHALDSGLPQLAIALTALRRRPLPLAQAQAQAQEERATDA